MWPENNVPSEYLLLAKKLIHQDSISEREFIELCKLAVKYIQSGKVSVRTRNDMALYIGNLWLRHENIGDVSLLSEIGGQFAEWEIPGSFKIDDAIGERQWLSLLEMIDEADKNY